MRDKMQFRKTLEFFSHNYVLRAYGSQQEKRLNMRTSQSP